MDFDPPAYLDSIALAEWMRLLEYMKEKDFCQVQNLVPFALYCQAVSQYTSAIEHINSEGLVVDGRNESMVKNPSFTILKEAREAINRGSAQFGFSPGDLKALKLEARESTKLPEWATDL